MTCHENLHGTFPEGPPDVLVSGEGRNCALWVSRWVSVCHSCSGADKQDFEHESALLQLEKRMALQSYASEAVFPVTDGRRNMLV